MSDPNIYRLEADNEWLNKRLALANAYIAGWKSMEDRMNAMQPVVDSAVELSEVDFGEGGAAGVMIGAFERLNVAVVAYRKASG